MAISPNILAIIPARAGSKRVPGKNLRPFGGMPLVEHTLRCAVESGVFNSIILSSDSSALLDLASDYPEVTPLSRSAVAAGDRATVVDVIEEMLDQLPSIGIDEPDAIMILQPTSPFRRVQTVQRAVERYRQGGGESVISVSHAMPHPYWSKRIDGGGVMHDFLPHFDEYTQSQGLPEVYALNGLIYLVSLEQFRASRSVYSAHTQGLVVDSAIEALDIDTEDEWFIAESVYLHQQQLRERGE